MERAFRTSMNWLHTWAGVVLGGVLFAIFWMGTLSVFDREIDRWMAPATRFAAPAEPVISIDALRRFYDAAVVAKSPIWGVTLPTERAPAMRVSWREGSVLAERFIDPATGALLPDAGTLGGTRFLYPFHYMLHVRVGQIGYWFVGLAGMAMMALCVSGIVVHRKFFADFFTLRADRMPRRLILDLHNVTGVLALPFHFVISLSGLMIFATLYFPSTWQRVYEGDQRTFSAEAHGTIRLPKAGRPAGMASFDAMAAEARRLWGDGPLRTIIVRNPGDAKA
ncbi:MAG: PepSY-associated TM helix domain-containing protein, partial [Moraxellaceae bacterium]|nr:PepSY-associated TM helix domain-containing protein [Moraxellaceae bacterium]